MKSQGGGRRTRSGPSRVDAVAAAILLVLSIAGGLIQQRDSGGLYPDTYRYVKISEAMREGDLGSYHSQFGRRGAVIYPAGFPAAIRVVAIALGEPLKAAVAVSLAVGSLMAPLAYLLARRLHASPGVALLAGVLCLSDPFVSWMRSTATTEGIVAVCIVGGLHQLMTYLAGRRSAALVGVAALGCAAVVVRSEAIGFFVILAGAGAWTLYRSGDRSGAARVFVAILAPVAIIFAADLAWQQQLQSRVQGSTRLTSMVRLALAEEGLFPNNWQLGASGESLAWVEQPPKLLQDWWLGHTRLAVREAFSSCAHGLHAFFLLGGNPWSDRSEAGRSILRGGSRALLGVAVAVAVAMAFLRRTVGPNVDVLISAFSVLVGVSLVCVTLALMSQRPYQMERMLSPFLPAAFGAFVPLLASALESWSKPGRSSKIRSRQGSSSPRRLAGPCSVLAVLIGCASAAGYVGELGGRCQRLHDGTSVRATREEICRELRAHVPMQARIMVDSSFLYPVILSGHDLVFTPSTIEPNIVKYLDANKVEFALVSEMRYGSDASRLEQLTSTLNSIGRPFRITDVRVWEQWVRARNAEAQPLSYRLVELR